MLLGFSTTEKRKERKEEEVTESSLMPVPSAGGTTGVMNKRSVKRKLPYFPETVEEGKKKPIYFQSLCLNPS